MKEKQVLKEWFISAPWGKIALISWGNPEGEPMLLIHGRQDSAATFIPLLGLMPYTYHYVGVDLPGHGRSDPFPTGVCITRVHFISVIDLVVQRMGWTKFIFMAHSMGGEIGYFYNAIRPGKVTKFILLDVGPAFQSIQNKPIHIHYKNYEAYYENYAKGNADDRIFTKKRALEAVMNARYMDEKQADLILSRNLTPVAEDGYKISWDRRLKYLPTEPNLDNDFMVELFKNSPPTLFISATLSQITYKGQGAEELIRRLEKGVKGFIVRHVEGTHDVHFMNPQACVGYIMDFLEKNTVKSKL